MARQRGRQLFKTTKRRRGGCLTILLLLLSLVVLVLALNGLSNRYVKLVDQKVTVLDLNKSMEGFTILHISDLAAAKLGDKQENIKSALGKETYNLVALTGDMVGKSGNAQPLLDLLDLVPDSIPVFMVPGDSDPSPYRLDAESVDDIKADYIKQAEEKGATFLEAPELVTQDGKSLWVSPADSFLFDLKNAVFALNEQIRLLESGEAAPNTASQLLLARYRLARMEESIQALTEMKQGDIILALSHQPPENEALTELSRAGKEQQKPVPSLFLAGQFNAGQLRLPGLGPLYIPPQMDGRGGFLPGDDGFVGLSIVKGFPVYVSPGLGVSGYYPLPLRLFNRPAITLLHLTSKMTR